MGTIRNEMTIVHHWDKDKIESVREDAIKFFNEVADEDVAESMISPIMQSHINQEYTFVINGDCSKIGWETSERYHKARMKWCEKHKYDAQNIIVINFGEDDEPCYIVFDSKAENRYDLLPPANHQETITEFADRCRECGAKYGKLLKQKQNSDFTVLEDIKAEIKQWYWQADKQALAKDSCVVDSMINLFIRTIEKKESEE